MQKCGTEEDAAGELGAQKEEAFVPAEEVGGHAADECAHQENDQTEYLREDQLPGSKVNVFRGVVVAASVAIDSEQKGKDEEEKKESRYTGHGRGGCKNFFFFLQLVSIRYLCGVSLLGSTKYDSVFVLCTPLARGEALESRSR